MQTAPDSSKAQRVQDAIQHWEQHHPKEVAARGARLTELKQALAEQGTIARTAPRHEPKVVAGGTHALLQQSMAGLEKLGSYACTDAPTFVQPNNPNYQKIFGKLDAFDQDPQRKVANQRANGGVNMAAIQTRNKQPLPLRTLENIAKAVDQAQAGCCSTLAYSAAAELLRHNSDQRIEVLAHRGAQGHAETHCFVVIGRAEGSELSKPESWGPNAKLVDPWAATIGAPLIGTPAKPPIANLWPPTESVFDNAHQED